MLQSPPEALVPGGKRARVHQHRPQVDEGAARRQRVERLVSDGAVACDGLEGAADAGLLQPVEHEAGTVDADQGLAPAPSQTPGPPSRTCSVMGTLVPGLPGAPERTMSAGLGSSSRGLFGAPDGKERGMTDNVPVSQADGPAARSCSPTRAALLTGRNHHRVGFGSIAEYPGPFPGYTA